MKNSNFVSDSIKALTQTLEMARDYYATGHASIILRDFPEARRLLTTALTCVERGLEIYANLMEHAPEALRQRGSAHGIGYISMLLSFIRVDTQNDLDILKVCERLHNEGALPPIASVMH